MSKSPYDAECLKRAASVEIDGESVRVVTAEDLLIHKMFFATIDVASCRI